MEIDLNTFKNDWDWQAAFNEAYHGQYMGYTESVKDLVIDKVDKVLYSSPGENEGANWIAIVEWSGSEGKYAYVSAGCDYTGWDCQAGGTIEFSDTLSGIIAEIIPEDKERLGIT